MTELTAAQTVAATAGPIGEAGAKFMLHPETREVGAGKGFEQFFSFYAAGRGGVLGDVDADVVVASFGFFEPNLVRAMWQVGTSVMGARSAADLFTEACRDWGRARLAGEAHMERLAELGERVVRAVDPSGLALFAGWRAQPLPDDAPGRAYQLLHVLREWRGSAHLVAVLASGLSPREAILGRDGEERAKMFGWQAPYPDGAALRERRNHAEALTDMLCEPVYERALTGAERAEFVQLVTHVAGVLR